MMSLKGEDTVKVGSRKSELALIQTRHVISLLKNLYPTKEFEIVKMSTLGDRVLNVSLPKIGEKSLFTKDLEEALDNGSVDMVVHSLKDLPTALPTGMAIGAVLEREDARDALVLREDFKGHTLATLPAGSIIGTSSLRRTAQLSRNYPHLKVVDIRGNLNTRLKKLDCHCTLKTEENETNGVKNSNVTNGSSDGNTFTLKESEIPDYVALILAQAGLVRMGWQHRISQVLPSDEVLYAVGQGALAVECKANNNRILEMLGPLNHGSTYCRILSERSFLKTLGGGCSAPVAISTTFKQHNETNYSMSEMEITGAVWSLNGKIKIEDSLRHTFNADEVDGNVDKLIKKHKLINNGNSNGIENSNVSNSSKRLCQGLENEVVNKKSFIDRAECCRKNTFSMTMEKIEPTEIENLINAHGKLFLCCPFSDSKGANCPVRLPIGMDFMGKCPMVDQELSEEELKDQLVMLHPRKITYDIKKCPFMSNQIQACNAKTETVNISDDYNIENEPGAKNCPFIKNKLKAETHNSEDASSSSDNQCKQTETIIEEIKLYCGLTKHFHIPQPVIEKCEELGQKLAQTLIKSGALEVMKCAQDHIRSTAPLAIVSSK